MDEEALLGVSWHDSNWIPLLNPMNVMEYFSNSQFYDRSCNNEHIKMQRLGPEHLKNMTGLEYELIHTQQPILYIIRKQHRSSPEQVTPMAQYYIIAGRVYQAPDLSTLVSSRLLNATFQLQSALDKAWKSARFHPSKGYWWDNEDSTKESDEPKGRDQAASWFQRHRVDLLLGELCKTYPMKMPPVPAAQQAPGTTNLEQKTESAAVVPQQVKTEKRSAPTDAETSVPSKMARIKAEPLING